MTTVAIANSKTINRLLDLVDSEIGKIDGYNMYFTRENHTETLKLELWRRSQNLFVISTRPDNSKGKWETHAEMPDGTRLDTSAAESFILGNNLNECLPIPVQEWLTWATQDCTPDEVVNLEWDDFGDGHGNGTSFHDADAKIGLCEDQIWYQGYGYIVGYSAARNIYAKMMTYYYYNLMLFHPNHA